MINRRAGGDQPGEGEQTLPATSNRRPRLLLYSDGHELGGAEVHLGYLLELLPDRFEVSVAVTDVRVLDHLARRRPGVPATLLPRIRSRIDVRGVLAHLRFLIRTRPDLLQISLNRPWGSQWPVLAGLVLPGVQVIVVDHAPRRPANWRHRLYLRLVPRFAAAHVATGQTTAATVAGLVGASARIEIIAPGVADVASEGNRRPSPPFVIGTVARLDREKGIDVLLTALGALPGVELVIVGDGQERPALEQLAATLGVADRVQFTGWRVDPRHELERFDLFVLPSRLEALPLSIVEAMLAELPVVATPVGGVPEMVTTETGLLVNPDDPHQLAGAIRTLLDDPARMRRLGQAGRQQALVQFSATAMTTRFVALYDRLLGSGVISAVDDGSGAAPAAAPPRADEEEVPAAIPIGRWMLVAPAPGSSAAAAEGAEATGLRAPDFSVVIAAYNAAEYLAEAIESALAQTLAPVEIIVCDDGSSDATLAIARRFGPPVRVLSHAHAGAAAAKNACWQAAQTEFVVVLDSDDLLDERCLEAYAAAARARPDLDILTSDAYLELDGRVFDRYYRDKARFVVADQRLGALHQHFIFGLAALRREALAAVGGYDESLVNGIDTDVFLRMILAGSRAGLIPEPLSRYRFKPESLSADRGRSMEAMIRILERAAQHPSLSGSERRYLEEDLAIKRRLTSLALAERDLRRGSPEFRARALRIVRNEPPVFGRRSRVAAAAAAVAPPMARRLLDLRDGGDYARRAARRS
jgi:glycosyltransferase involved in cell wall biosynthesis